MWKYCLFFITIITILLSSCQGTLVEDDANNSAYSFTAVAERVKEGENIPVHLYFKDGGLVVDNPSWGNKWEKASFFAEIYDSYSRQVSNAVFSGPGGIIGNGSRFDINPDGKMDIVISGLREGTYSLRLNVRTRYMVDTYASTSIVVDKRKDVPVEDDVVVDDFTVPGSGNGLEIDDIGNIVLDLRVFNAGNPFRFRSVVRPEDAADKQLLAESSDELVASIRVEGETLLIITPRILGRNVMTVRSRDGGAMKTFGVTVIESVPDVDGFTLPTDDSERGAYDFDVAGRLELDINVWNTGNPFVYHCKPIPAEAGPLSLVAESDKPNVAAASIRNGSELVITPQSPGYAVVTVSTTDGTIVRKLHVAVISNVVLTIDSEEGERSEEDKKTGIFPCKLTFKADTKWTPSRMRVQVRCKATGRVDLTDPADYFKIDSLKNARTAYYSYTDDIPVLYLSSGNSAYQLYDRVMKKVAAMGVVIHHSDDWPNYYDYVKYFALHKIELQLYVIDDFDTNLYRVTLDRKYNSPAHLLYHYL